MHALRTPSSISQFRFAASKLPSPLRVLCFKHDLWAVRSPYSALGAPTTCSAQPTRIQRRPARSADPDEIHCRQREMLRSGLGTSYDQRPEDTCSLEGRISMGRSCLSR
jgi:hypothetical protein